MATPGRYRLHIIEIIEWLLRGSHAIAVTVSRSGLPHTGLPERPRWGSRKLVRVGGLEPPRARLRGF
jgi:hypothetical protein